MTEETLVKKKPAQLDEASTFSNDDKVLLVRDGFIYRIKIGEILENLLWSPQLKFVVSEPIAVVITKTDGEEPEVVYTGTVHDHETMNLAVGTYEIAYGENLTETVVISQRQKYTVELTISTQEQEVEGGN